MKHLAIYGGTFSPIHHGHINTASALQERFNFDQLIFLPNKEPVIDKTTTASPSDRIAMLKLALVPYPSFIIDERELNRPTPSFMVETLTSIHRELGDDKAAITLIIGMDSFLQFHRWHDWHKIVSLCNLIVLERPGHKVSLPIPLQEAQAKGEMHLISDASELATGSSGGFYFYNAGEYDISSTKVRELIASGGNAGPFLPKPVLDYIEDNELFGYRKAKKNTI